MTQEEEFAERFYITSRKCESSDVVITTEPFTDYGGETGSSGGWVTFGCNACKQNDYQLMP